MHTHTRARIHDWIQCNNQNSITATDQVNRATLPSIIWRYNSDMNCVTAICIVRMYVFALYIIMIVFSEFRNVNVKLRTVFQCKTIRTMIRFKWYLMLKGRIHSNYHTFAGQIISLNCLNLFRCIFPCIFLILKISFISIPTWIIFFKHLHKSLFCEKMKSCKSHTAPIQSTFFLHSEDHIMLIISVRKSLDYNVILFIFQLKLHLLT